MRFVRDETDQAWWDARYFYADKKKSHTGDRFVRFLLALWTWTNSSVGGREVRKLFQETFLSPEMEKAIALDDRLEVELAGACAVYLQTLDLEPRIFGLRMGKSPSLENVMARVANMIAGGLIPGVYELCAGLDRVDVVVRGFWMGAEAVFPGIAEMLERVVRGYGDEAMCAFVLGAVQG